MHTAAAFTLLLSLVSATVAPSKREDAAPKINVQVGDRPYYLVNNMDQGSLKQKLQSCSEGPFKTTDFVFTHRGAPLQYPEHTLESYTAARRQGAGVIECDATFTKDKQLVCRHDQCDLHTTTNILNRTDLAAKCTKPFTPAANGQAADAKCCTSDITTAEFKSLCGKMDGFNPDATTAADYMRGTPYFRTDLYATCGTLVTHEEYINLVQGWGLKFTPELKQPQVTMPFNGYTLDQYRQDLIDAYKKKGIDASRVYPQSFIEDDIFYWVQHEPKFGKQALYLDQRVYTPDGLANATATMSDLYKRGVRIMAPYFAVLMKLDSNNNIVPSDYAIAAKEAGMEIITWSLERTGWLKDGGDYFYATVAKVINNDGDMYTVLDVLARQVKIKAMFADWPATVTYYANCWGLGK